MKQLFVVATLGMFAFGFVLMGLNVSSIAREKGKTRPLTSHDLMEELVLPQYKALGKGIEEKPTEEKAWKHLRAHAALVNECSHILMADGRCPDEEWKTACKQMEEGSLKILDAIEAKDVEAAAEGFTTVKASCKTCHTKHKYPYDEKKKAAK